MTAEQLLLQSQQSTTWLALAAVLALLPGPVSAQTAALAPEKTAPPAAAPDSAFAKQPGALSDKLNASHGVIRPNEVDPKMEKPAPSTGATAVIPPPGSPGGPQGVQPK